MLATTTRLGPLRRPNPHRPDQDRRLRTGATVKASRAWARGRAVARLQLPGVPRTGAADIDEAVAGDIVALSACRRRPSLTPSRRSGRHPLPAQPIDPPTLTVTFGVNDTPLAGRDGNNVTSRVIRERLLKEVEWNVALQVTDTAKKDAFKVTGRGGLQELGILIENMRREGYELTISRPHVIIRDDDGNRLEPIEDLAVDVDDDYTGGVMEMVTGPRRAEVVRMKPAGAGKTRIIAHIPSRGLIGFTASCSPTRRGRASCTTSSTNTPRPGACRVAATA